MAKIKGNRNIYVVIGIILFFILVSLVYFSPLIEGKRLSASDSQHYAGMSQEISDFRSETGEEALWTNRMFGGMPAYLISVRHSGEVLANIQKFVNNVIPRPASLIFLSFLFFFILCLTLGMNPYISMGGAFMYGMATYFFVLISAGHITKVHTLSYMALVVAGVILAYKKKPLVGSLLAAFGLSWMLSGNHPQMTYYAGIMVAIIGITYLGYAIREKAVPAFMKTSVLLVVAMIIAVGTNFGRLYTTYEYSKYSTRGESELTSDEGNKTQGLDKDYILDYSYDLGEVMSSFIPRFKGGGMSEPLDESSEVYKFFEENQGKAAAKNVVAGLPLYWGTQPISSAPFYFGAVLCFLFVFGLFVVKGKDKWWIVAVVVASFLLSLGKNFPLLSNFMIDYFPGYNKFRDVKNIIVIQQFAMALLGVLAIKELYLNNRDKGELIKNLKYSWIIAGGLALVFAVLPGLAGNFKGATDAQLVSAGWPDQLIQALQSDRKMVLRTDAFKALVFVTMAAGVIWLFVKQKIKASYALALWVLLIFIDMWPVNKKYLNNDNFESKSKVENPYTATVADQEILKDTDPDYRVLNISVSVFQDASTSYFHNSIGGYHGAKMERYQELFDYQIAPELSQLTSNFTSLSAIDSALQSLPVLNMLNTKYVIYSPETAPIQNYYALGHAWFVDDVTMVENADEEIAALSSIDPSSEAIIDQCFAEQLANISSDEAAGSQIEMIEYMPNYLKYNAQVNSGTLLAVFSEIYYPKGWTAYIDGVEFEHLRANYVLRALPIPEGVHEVEFKFEPESYFIGDKVSLASSIILLLAMAAVGFMEFRKKVNNEEETLDKA